MQVWKIELQKGKMCKGGKYKYEKIKYCCARMENVSVENSSTSGQGWKLQVRKNRVWNKSTGC